MSMSMGGMSSRRAGWLRNYRRAAMAAPAIVLIAACAAPSNAPSASGSRALLTPWLMLTGARISPVAETSGMPSLQAMALPFSRFIHPSAVAALGNDIYIVDSGAGAVYHLDVALNLMVRVQGISAFPATRLAIGSDYSVYAVDQQARRVVRFARGGQPLTSYSDASNLAQPVDLALDESRGRVLVADRMFNQIVAFNPLGRASYVIALRGDTRHRVMSIGAIAAAPEGIYVSDPVCRCVVQLAPDGTAVASFGYNEIGQPGAIAVDTHQRVWVVDTFDRSLKVFAKGRLVYRTTAADLGVTEVSAMWLDNGMLYLADGAGARIAALRLSPPAPTE
jgi:hypothetical protein